MLRHWAKFSVVTAERAFGFPLRGSAIQLFCACGADGPVGESRLEPSAQCQQSRSTGPAAYKALHNTSAKVHRKDLAKCDFLFPSSVSK